MKLDSEKIDEAILALLLLGIHDESRAWKGFDWEAMNRLHDKGFISDPRGNARSIIFTEKGLIEARHLLGELFSQASEGGAYRLGEQVFAVVRVDHFQEQTEDSCTVKEIVRSQEMAESEVARLNRVNDDKRCTYFWQPTRLFSSGQSAGGATDNIEID